MSTHTLATPPLGSGGTVLIESVGFTLMDMVDGNFWFHLVSLRAVYVLGGEVVGSLEDKRREEEFRERLQLLSGPSPSREDEEEKGEGGKGE
jgi:hypothetical protein